MRLLAVGPKKEHRVFVLLVVSATVAIIFIAAGGFTVYRNLRHTERERDWVDHSEVVLANLQEHAQRLSSVDYNLQLYAATGERAKLRATSRSLSLMAVGLVQDQELVKDNPSQSRHVREFGSDLEKLTAAAGGEHDPVAGVTDKLILDCRQDIEILQQEERGLLQERIAVSKASSFKSFLLSSAYLGFSLLIVLVLFVFLFRDALRKRVDEANLLAAQRTLEDKVQQLRERARESALLTGARDELQLCTTPKQAHESAVRHMEQLVPGTSGAALMINNSRSMVEVVARWGKTIEISDGFDPDGCCGLRAGKARWRKPVLSELHCAHFVGKAPENYLCMPLAAHGETLGFIFVCCDTAEALEIVERRGALVQELGELASLSIASLNLRTKLEGQSIRDGLTGLFNRSFMEIALERELHRAARRGTPVGLLMLDVDHFKRLNDTCGHEAGDVMLRAVAECLQNSLRTEDIICRYGGEEFVVIMPDAAEEIVMRRAETIRRTVEEQRTFLRGEMVGPVTISIGVAVSPEYGSDGADLLRVADAALYRAKHEGRNRVVMEADALQVA